MLTSGAFLWENPKTDHWSKIVWIRVHQRNWWIHSGKGFFVVLRRVILHTLRFVYITLCIIMRVACQALKGASYYTKHKISQRLSTFNLLGLRSVSILLPWFSIDSCWVVWYTLIGMETLASASANKKLFGAPQRFKTSLEKTIEDAQGISKWLTKCRLRLFSSSYDTKKTIQVSTGIRSSFNALLFQLASRRFNQCDCRKTYQSSWRGLRYVQNVTTTKYDMCVLLLLGKVVEWDIWSYKSHKRDYTRELLVRKLAPFRH